MRILCDSRRCGSPFPPSLCYELSPRAFWAVRGVCPLCRIFAELCGPIAFVVALSRLHLMWNILGIGMNVLGWCSVDVIALERWGWSFRLSLVLFLPPASLTSWCSTSMFGNLLVIGGVGAVHLYGLHSFSSISRIGLDLLATQWVKSILFRFHSLVRGPCKLMLRNLVPCRVLVPFSTVGMICQWVSRGFVLFVLRAAHFPHFRSMIHLLHSRRKRMVWTCHRLWIVRTWYLVSPPDNCMHPHRISCLSPALRVLNIRSWKGKGGNGSTGRRQCIWNMTRATPVTRGAHSRAGRPWRWSTLDIIHISLSRRAERGMLLHGLISAKKRPDINHTALTQLALQAFRA